MTCKICQMGNAKLVEAIEEKLLASAGSLFLEDKKELQSKFPEFVDKIDALTDRDCELHYNFHQRICRVPRVVVKVEEAAQPKENKSLADDIGKDEAAVLYELLNEQAATFTLLNNRIANQIKDTEKEDGSKLLLHAGTTQFYKELADSIRATVRAIGDLNVSLNGQKDGSIEGLKALAGALFASRGTETPKVSTHPQDNPVDGTTTMFDD